MQKASEAASFRVRPYIFQHLPSIALGYVVAALLGVITSIMGSIAGPAIQFLVNPQDVSLQLLPRWLLPTEVVLSVETLAQALPLLLVSVGLLRALLIFVQWFIWERFGERVARSARRQLVAGFLHSAGHQSDATEVAANIGTDIRMVKDYLIHTYGGLPREALQVAILVWTLYTISPELLLQFSIVVFPMAIAVRVVGKTLKRRTKKALVQSSQLTEWLQQRLLGVETIKHHGTEELELTKMAAVAGLLEQRMVRSIIVKALSAPVMQLFVGIATALVLFIATDVTRFRGDVVMSFFATVALLSQSAGKMGRYLAAMSQGQAAIGRLRATLTQISGSEQKISASKNVGDKTYLELDQVTIRYPNAPRPAIENLTAKFEPGKFYVLCGHSGAGKSSVMRAVLGLTPIHGGKINIGVKQDIDWPIVFVPQTIALAPLSIAENVSYPDAAVDTVKLQKALVAAGMEREIAAMPDGAETIVGESGQALSGGQMQRLLLARAFYHDNPFVLIDEGTSALDPGKELIVLHGCKELARAGRCVIMIAHRPKALEYADCVLVLADGKRVAWGSPDDAQVKSAISGSL